MLSEVPEHRRMTVGADPGYDTRGFIEGCRRSRVTPHVTQKQRSAIDRRTTSERYNSSAKHSRLLDIHRYFKIEKVALHDAMSMLSYLATALAHLQADDYDHVLHMRIKLPKVPKSKSQQSLSTSALQQAAWRRIYGVTIEHRVSGGGAVDTPSDGNVGWERLHATT